MSNQLTATGTTTPKTISIFDGRYRHQCVDLCKYFTEETYTQIRYDIELAWLKTQVDNFYPMCLSESSGEPSEPPNPHEKRTILAQLAKMPKTLTPENLDEIKRLEQITNHDVKAIELFIKAELDKLTPESPIREWVHMCLTSQDVCSPAQTFMLWNATNHLVAQLGSGISNFQDTTLSWGRIPMLAHTHGQPAIPTLLGKELLFHTQRIGKTLDCLSGINLTYKFGGAIGTWASGCFTYPSIGLELWNQFFDETFREREELGYIIHGNLKFGLLFIQNPGQEFITRSPLGQTTQTDDYSSYYRLIGELCLLLRQIRAFADYIRALIHDEYLVQVPVATETGSSTMPQKVNPIHFENIKANVELAIAVLRSIGDTIMMGEYQRDMSDSTALRSFSTAFGYIGIVLANLQTGLGRIAPNREHIRLELNRHPEVIMEAVQTVCRRWNIAGAYELAKEFSRGRTSDNPITLTAIREEYIKKIPGLPDQERERLLALTPETYLGF
jgi:adenylosuccinate lyase